MSRPIARRLLAAVVGAVAALAVLVGPAAAADECAGLQVCLPVEGPWVVIPAPAAGLAARADWILACPLRGYIVAGIDVRLSDRQIDVGIRGETGSPVSPGTTTREAVLFSGLYAGTVRRAVAFRPFVGCIPTSGGGARGQTARAAGGEGLKPTRPVSWVVVERKITARAQTASARCPAQARLVDWSHGVAFRTALQPDEAVLDDVRTTARVAGGVVTVRVAAAPSALSSAPLVQLRLACVRTGR